MRYLIIILIALLPGCHMLNIGAPPSTGQEQKVIKSAAEQIENDQKGILQNNEAIKKKLPDDKEPKNIDELANSSLAQVKRLQDANASLKLKNEESKQQIDALIKDRDNWKDQAENRYAWMYGAMILVGVGLIALGGGLFVFTQGTGWKMAATSASTGLVVLVLGITIPEYAEWIGLAGAGIMALAMGFGVWVVMKNYKEKDKTVKRDHHIKRQLVKDMQATLETMPGDKAIEVMNRMSHERDDEYKTHIKELKALDGLGKPRIVVPTKQ